MASHVGKVIKSTLASVMVVAMVPSLSLAETVGDGADSAAAVEPVVQGSSMDEDEADLVSEATATQQPLSDELLISEVDAAEDEPAQSEAATKPERWTPPANAARDAWYRHSDGTWSYVNANGAAALGWRKLSGKWYYLDPETTKAALWEKTIDGKRYYFNESNQMVTGWLQWGHDKSWSYYDASGAMASGWRKVGGKWYYLDPQTGKAPLWEKTIDGKRYYFDGSNAMVTGWLKYKDGSWSYYNSDGAAATGWKKLGGKWYYLDPNTTRAALWEKTIDGKRYYFDGSNAMVTGWLKYKDGSWSYYNSDGAAATGWKKLSGKWYYLDPSTTRAAIWSRTIDGKQYYFDSSNAMVTGWLQWNNDKTWSYFDSSGVMVTGTQTIDGIKYVFDANGRTRQEPPKSKAGLVMAIDRASNSKSITSFGGSTPSSIALSSLKSAINTIQNGGDSVSFLMVDIKTGAGIAYDAGKTYYAASTVKGPYVASICRSYPGSVSKYKSMMSSIAVYSDDILYQDLRREVGNSCFQSFNSYSSAGLQDMNTWTFYTTKNLAKLWVGMYWYFFEDTNSQSAFCRNLFTHPKTSFVYPALRQYTTYSKAGWGIWPNNPARTPIYSDAGIVMSGDRPYILVVMSTAYQKQGRMETLVKAINACHESMI